MMYFKSLVRFLTVPAGTKVVASSVCLVLVGPRVYGGLPDSVVRAPSECLLDAEGCRGRWKILD